MSVDLETGLEQEVLRSKNNFTTMRVSGENLVLMEWVDTEGEATEIVVVSARDHKVKERFELGNRYATSHFADYRDGWITWAEFPLPTAAWPTLYARSPDGEIVRLGVKSLDTCFAGRYVFFESNRDVSTGTLSDERTQIWAADLEQGTRALVAEAGRREGMWQTGLVGAKEGVFMATRDDGLHAKEGERANTVVRCYRPPKDEQ